MPNCCIPWPSRAKPEVWNVKGLRPEPPSGGDRLRYELIKSSSSRAFIWTMVAVAKAQKSTELSLALAQRGKLSPFDNPGHG